MCTVEVLATSYPGGSQEQTRTQLCPNAWDNRPCNNVHYITHSPQPYMAQFPPTPQYSPSPSHYRSSDDSDHSYHSSSSRRRTDGLYLNGQRIVDTGRGERPRRSDRKVVIQNSSAPRTPPQAFTAPASPNSNSFTAPSPPQRSRTTRRPSVVINDPRRVDPHLGIEIVESGSSKRPSRSRSHSRHTSTSSHSDEDRRRRRERKHEDEINARIVSANNEINNRAPLPPVGILKKRPSSYKRPAVEVPFVNEDVLEKFERMKIEDERRRLKAYRDEKAREDEAQRKRLEERMTPSVPARRSSVSHRPRRHQVMYNDGTYRWE